MLLAVVVIALGAVAFVRARGNDDIDRARSAIENGDFANGVDAGETLADAAEALLAASRDCDGDGQRCDAIAAAAGYVQVAASRAIRCTAPDRELLRRSALEVIDVADAGRRPPARPLPDCV